ncbi:hypothetical protein AGMMS49992_17130 [Clostridia bacterium]|nr:hypothetical protein AGMMS49992_17130 [Clostridia bacterium]
MSKARFVSCLLVLLLLVSALPAYAATEPFVQLRILYGSSGFILPDPNNPIREAIQEKTGIDVLMEPWYYTGDDEFNTRLNMWAASGDLPFDVFLGGGGTYAISLYNMMGESGLLRNLEPDILSSEAMTKFVAHTFPKYRDGVDGSVYMYPFHLNSAEMYGNLRDAGIATRIDWLSDLDLDEPDSPEAFYDMLVKMKDAYGIAPLSTSDGNFYQLAIQFIGLDGMNFWEKDADGTYRIAMFNKFDKLIDYAVFMNKLWNEGLMDQESFTQKPEQLVQKLSTGKAGVSTFVRHSVQATINDILWGSDPEALLAFIPAFPADGVKAGNNVITNWGGGLCVVNAKIPTEKMEALVKYWDFVLSKDGTILTFMGVEGEQWEYDENGKAAFLPDFITQYPTENERQEFGLWHYQAPACSWFRIDQYAAPKPEYSRKDYAYSMANCNDTIELDDLTYGVVAGDEEQLRLPSINDSWKQTIVKAIMASSEAECRAVMEAFPKTLDSLGYDLICKERTELTKTLEDAVK